MITFGSLMEDLQKQGVDFNKFKNRNGKVYLRDTGEERTEISSKDENCLLLTYYFYLKFAIWF